MAVAAHDCGRRHHAGEDLPEKLMRRLWIAVGWLIIAAILYFSLATLSVETGIEGGDKLGHLLAYGALMAWWSQLYVSTSIRWQLGIAFIALGAAMELAQGLTPNRYPEWLDLAANTAGVILGWFAAPPRIPSFYARLAAAFPVKPR
jgi:VanZ family protein